jgi:membrane protein DedA with SNARE-associated domain
VEFTTFSEILFPFASEVGYLALALASFFASLIPFIPLPYFIVLATMSVGQQFNIHALAIIAAVTATSAKMSDFYVSYGGGKMMSEAARKRMKPFERLVKKYGAAAAFVAAATPIPDDFIYVPLGLAKYNPLRFFIATLTGKLVLAYVIVLISHFVGLSLLDPLLEDVEDANTIYIGFAVFVIIMITIIVLMLKLDWQRVLGKMAPWTLEEDKEKENG